jgi:predicted acylesterase/phospholipase RssA
MIKGCSLDGGGVKAIDEALIIEFIERETEKSFYTFFDRIAGTSAGSEIACQLVYKKRTIPGEEIVDNFRMLSSRVFSTSFWRKAVAGNFSSKYRVESLAEELLRILPNSKMDEARRPLTIPTINGDTGEEVFVKSDNELKHWDMWAACTASSAAPYYFNGFEYRGHRYFDGGGAFNNPARILYRDLEKFHGANYSNTFILSLGCTFQEFSPYPNGGVQWLSRLFEFGNRPATNTTATFLTDDLGEKHVRIVIPHKEKIALDESSLKAIDRYIKETHNWIKENKTFLCNLCDLLEFS